MEAADVVVVKLPVNKLNILGDRYVVSLCRMKAFGECNQNASIITLRPNQSADQARDTLLHETIHAIDHIWSLKLTEDQTRLLATGLRATFTANPKFGKWVSE